MKASIAELGFPEDTPKPLLTIGNNETRVGWIARLAMCGAKGDRAPTPSLLFLS